jgi:hypothetical protein
MTKTHISLGKPIEETLVAQHISLFQNSSTSNDIVTANPVAVQDTYFIARGKTQKPDYNVLVNKGKWNSYDDAFPHANFVYTGKFAYCFWDTGASQIAGVTAQDPYAVQMISPDVHAGYYRLIVSEDGTIAFAKAT